MNGQSLGTKRLAEAEAGVLRWQVPFAPGELKAVGRTDGRNLCEFVLRTAGPASRIELKPDASGLRADGRDISQLEFTVVDAQGVRAAPSAPSYIAWNFLIIGGGIGAAFALWRGPTFLFSARTEWRPGLAAGATGARTGSSAAGR